MKILVLLSASLAVTLARPPPAPPVPPNPGLTKQNYSPLLGDQVPAQGHVEVEVPAPQVMVVSQGKEQIKVEKQQENDIHKESKMEPEVKDMEVKVETKVKDPEVKAEQEVKDPEVKVKPEVEDPEVLVEPEVKDLEVQVEPEVGDPELKMVPEVGDPEVKMVPEVKDPKVQVEPEVEKPEVQVEPEVKDLKVQVEPEVEEPEFKMVPEVEDPEVQVEPEVEEPEVQVEPEVEDPQVQLEPEFEVAEFQVDPEASKDIFVEVKDEPGVEEIEVNPDMAVNLGSDPEVDPKPEYPNEPHWFSMNDEEFHYQNFEEPVNDERIYAQNMFEPIMKTLDSDYFKPARGDNPELSNMVRADGFLPVEDNSNFLSNDNPEKNKDRIFIPDPAAMVEGQELYPMDLQMQPSTYHFSNEEPLQPFMQFVDQEAIEMQDWDPQVYPEVRNGLAKSGGWSSCRGLVLQGKCYQFIPQPRTASDAEFYCQNNFFHGHLVSITSLDSHQKLMDMIRKENGGIPRTWIGGLRYLDTGRFVWLDGAQWGYEDWLWGEPNHTANVEHCVEILSNGKFNDFTCWEPQAFICSFPFQ